MQISKIILLLLIFAMSTVTLQASGLEIAKELHLTPGKKAIIQWERVFKSASKMKRYGIDTLSKKEQEILKNYLLDHAADSDHPTVAGM